MSDADQDPIALLARHTPEDRAWALDRLTMPQKREMHERWWRWAHDGQHWPPEPWAVWLIMAGRGFGKTRAGAEWVSAMARANAEARIALVGATAEEVRRVMIEGKAGLQAVARDEETVTFSDTKGEVQFSSGAVGYVFSVQAPEALRGPEHDYAWCDELAKWRVKPGKTAWNNLMMGLRGGEDARVVVTTTPKPTALMEQVETLAIKTGVVMRGRTHDNPHLAQSFVAAMVAQYGGTRLGRQELDGEMLTDIEGALWKRDEIEASRVAAAPEVTRVVIGVDPPAGTISGEGGDACGIVAVALGVDGHGYVLEDASVGGVGPNDWAEAVAACADRWRADRVIAEANNGGAMIESVLRAASATLPLTLVRASHGKVARAEPVQMLYVRGQVHHVGGFATLEDEMCGLLIGGGYEGPSRSPDRADALVWALHELMLERRSVARVRSF